MLDDRIPLDIIDRDGTPDRAAATKKADRHRASVVGVSSISASSSQIH